MKQGKKEKKTREIKRIRKKAKKKINWKEGKMFLNVVVGGRMVGR